MSLLTPLYILGALAIAAPIVFHLIRRSPRGEFPFSSLMFLAPTPPKLTRRSRLENWLLLLLRAAALGLLAFAFARPFLRQAARLDTPDEGGRRIALLVDASASMRRADLWTRALALAEEAIEACRPGDELAVFAFDEASTPLLGFEESATLDPARRLAVARSRLRAHGPTWAATDLGRALIDAVAAIEDVADARESSGRMPRRVVLIGDLQQGSRTDALGGFEWPSDVDLEIKAVADPRPNAGLQGLADLPEAEAGEADPPLRIRVSNDPGARQDRFRLAWVGAEGVEGPATEVSVPPGESRVARVPRPPGGSTGRSLRLRGDAHAFDNMLYLADNPEVESTVLYLGTDAAEDPDGLLYYLERVFRAGPRREARVRQASPASTITWEDGETVPLVILSTATTPANVGLLGGFVRDGGTLLVVLTSPEQAETLGALADTPPPEIAEVRPDGDAMLAEIAFDHPLFAPLAGPHFNDFTKIRFWTYRRLADDAIGESRVLARFEGGDPALFEKTVGTGRLVVLASGWGPADSQLARSSKFYPLMAGLLDDDGSPFEAADLVVGARVPLPDGGRVVRKPDGSSERLGPEATEFAGTDQPGIYTVEGPERPIRFAVNLDPAEGRTAPLDLALLEQYGCRLATQGPAPPDPERRRQLLNAELEGRQKLWRWLVLAALGILIVETWLAGLRARPQSSRVEALST